MAHKWFSDEPPGLGMWTTGAPGSPPRSGADRPSPYAGPERDGRAARSVRRCPRLLPGRGLRPEPEAPSWPSQVVRGAYQ